MRRRRLVVITVLLAAVVGIGGCKDAKHTGTGRVYNSEYGFSMVPPAGWTESDALPGVFMLHFGPQEGEFRVNLNVTVTKDDGTPVENYPAAMKPAYAKAVVDYEFVEDGFVEFDGRKWYRISSKFRTGQHTVQNLQFIAPSSNGKVYSITFTATAETFEKHRDTFDRSGITGRMD